MSLSGTNKDIKIPEKHYVGFQARSNDDVPLGFMTPDGDDAAAKKRKATVDAWASGGHYGRTEKKQIPAVSYENKKLTGFKLGRNVRHGGYGWGQGNVKWRIEDPRGFELEISSPNLASIMLCTTIENGEILEECVWGRLGSENILLPVSSDVYKAAVANSERATKKVGLKDLKPGHYVVLQNGDEGIYLGQHFTYVTSGGSYYNSTGPTAGWQDKKRQFIGQYKDGEWKSLECKASIKVAEVRESEVGTMTLAEAETLLNKLLGKPMGKYGQPVSTPGHDYAWVKGVSSTKPREEDSQKTFEPVTLDELTKMVKPRPSSHGGHYWEGDEINRYIVAKVPNSAGGFTAYQYDPRQSITECAKHRAASPVAPATLAWQQPKYPISHARLLKGDWENFDFSNTESTRSGYYSREYTDARIFEAPGVEFMTVKVSFTTPEGASGSFYL